MVLFLVNSNEIQVGFHITVPLVEMHEVSNYLSAKMHTCDSVELTCSIETVIRYHSFKAKNI